MRASLRSVTVCGVLAVVFALSVPATPVFAREVGTPTTIYQGPADPAASTIPAARMSDYLKRWIPFKTFTKALDSTGMARELNQGGPYTVFVPDDAAFARLPKANRDALFKDPARLRSVIRHHVVRGRVDALTLFRAPTLTDLDGRPIKVTNPPAPKGTYIAGAELIGSNLIATNGIAHVVANVLIPAK